MWDRKELKARGKLAFKANYWRSVLVAFLAMLITGVGTGASFRNSAENVANGEGPVSFGVSGPQDLAILGLIGGAVVLLIAIAVAISVFIMNPIAVGCCNFFLKNRRDHSTDINALERGFKGNYMNVVKSLFMTDLIIFLWSLLLIVPGIIKALEYRMVPYLLAEDPNKDYKTAMAESKAMMYGNKMDSFVLDLSFVGWMILGALSFGILNLLYVYPYIQATDAELFVAIAHPGDAMRMADITPQETPTVEFNVEEVTE